MFKDFRILFFIILIIMGTTKITQAEEQVAEPLTLKQTVQIESIKEPLTLKQAIQYALINNQELMALKNTLESQKKDIGFARSAFLPRLSFRESTLYTNTPQLVTAIILNQERFVLGDLNPATVNDPDPEVNFLTSFTVEQKIFFKRDIMTYIIAKKRYLVAEQLYLREQEELVYKVAQSYLTINAAAELFNAAQKASNEAKENLKVVNARYKDGTGSGSDVMRASTALMEIEQKLITARKNFNIAKRSLGLLLGVDKEVNVTNDIIEVPIYDYSYYKNAALSRKDVQALQLRYENVKNDVRLARADYYPRIDAGSTYLFNDHRAPFLGEGESFQVFGAINWDIFDGTKTRYAVARAKELVESTAKELEGLKNTASFQVYQAYLEAEETKKKLELAISALEMAQGCKGSVLSEYANGNCPFIDLSDTQASLDRIRSDVATSRNAYKLSLINLSYQSGTILEDLCLKIVDKQE